LSLVADTHYIVAQNLLVTLSLSKQQLDSIRSVDHSERNTGEIEYRKALQIPVSHLGPRFMESVRLVANQYIRLHCFSRSDVSVQRSTHNERMDEICFR